MLKEFIYEHPIIGSEIASKMFILQNPIEVFDASRTGLEELGISIAELERFGRDIADVCQELEEKDLSWNHRFGLLVHCCSSEPTLLGRASRDILIEIYCQTYKGVCEIKRELFLNK